MSRDQWSAVDRYIVEHLAPGDAALDEALRSSEAAGLPSISVSPNQGKLLHILAKMVGASRILEIGTLGGYSTIWLARALPEDGRLITLEADEKHANVARRNISRAGLDNKVELRIGRAIETLPKLQQEKLGPFDLTFIDADKQSNAIYLDWAIRLSRAGSMIIVDNVVRSGAIIDASSKDEGVQGTRRLYEALAKEKRVTATAIQTVGSKGYDGLAVAIVN